LRFKALIEEKGKHLTVLKGLNEEKKQIKDRISSYDNQKPEKLKKQQLVSSNLPQDEEELDKMVHYWENVLQTKTLKSKEEEDIMKKLSQLESMRASIGDYSNISKEIVNLRKQLQSIKAKVAEENLQLDRIKEGVEQNNKIINAYYDKHKNETEGERSEQEKIQEEIQKLSDHIDGLYKEKKDIIERFKEESKVLES